MDKKHTDKIRRDSERDHYFRSLKRSDRVVIKGNSDWSSQYPRIPIPDNSNSGQYYYAADAPEIRDHYLRSMRSNF